MCMNCGGCWPWAHPVQLAAEPVKDEYIYLDQNHSFYPDYRTVSDFAQLPSYSLLPR